MQSSFILHKLFFVFLLHLPRTRTAAEGPNITCSRKCGNLTVPYPFGIGINSSCSINPFFAINCDEFSDPPKAFLSTYNLEVLKISDTTIRIKNRVAAWCHDSQGKPHLKIERLVASLLSSPFSLSNENKLTVVGCHDSALLLTAGNGHEVFDPISSCSALCSKPGELSDGFCSGIGCCQSSIPEGLQLAMISLRGNAHRKIHNFSACGYSFLAEKSSYSFNSSDISDSSFVSRIIENVPIVIDWVIGNHTCNEIKNSSEFICQQNSVCVDSGSILGGYRCSCCRGYEGNPYLNPGCQDINECNDIKPCHQDATCRNLPGSFNCSCPLDYIGDGTKHGTGCIHTGILALYTGLLGGLGLSFIPGISFCLYKLLRKWRIKQVKQNLFARNVGLMLQQQMPFQDCILEKMRIFTSKELDKATDRFNKSRILGQGGQGTVYKGMLLDGRIIAIKKSKNLNQNLLHEFINEIVVLSQVNHRNVVKLLGCCLETEVPLLVYEFIPNKTLYHLIHEHDTVIPFSWEVRLRIAAEIGNALAYLHYSSSFPIYHRDMKSANILLDEKYRAKLSDFGISRSVKIDQTHLTTKVKGTFGYLDPEYFQTGQFTEKSDVYSFGVVLVELLTGLKPVGTGTMVTEDEEEKERSLVSRFLLAMEENRLKSILDSRISEQGVTAEVIAVSDLAKRCLNLKRNKRPNIREVTMELERIRTCENKFSTLSNAQDISNRQPEGSFGSDTEY